MVKKERENVGNVGVGISALFFGNQGWSWYIQSIPCRELTQNSQTYDKQNREKYMPKKK